MIKHCSVTNFSLINFVKSENYAWKYFVNTGFSLPSPHHCVLSILFKNVPGRQAVKSHALDISFNAVLFIFDSVRHSNRAFNIQSLNGFVFRQNAHFYSLDLLQGKSNFRKIEPNLDWKEIQQPKQIFTARSYVKKKKNDQNHVWVDLSVAI